MKQLFAFLSIAIITISSYGQSKEDEAKYKEWTKQGNREAQHYTFNHKQYWKNDQDWTFCKVAIHFKQITSDKVVETHDNLGKGNLSKTEAQSWAVLEGVKDETYQEIVDEFVIMLRDRLAPHGITVETWNTIKDNPNTEDIKKAVKSDEDMVIFDKNEGAAITKTADNGPYYSHVIVFVPGGKKLSKEINRLLAELDVVLDFAFFDMAMNAYLSDESWELTGNGLGSEWVKKKTYASEASGSVYPIVHIAPMFGGGMGEAFMLSTKLFAQDKYGYTSQLNLRQPIYSDIDYSTEIIKSNDLPENIKSNYKTIKDRDGWNHFFIYNVKTTDELYKEASLNALSKYLDDLELLIQMNK